jgi:hypothetical protein
MNRVMTVSIRSLVGEGSNAYPRSAVITAEAAMTAAVVVGARPCHALT